MWEDVALMNVLRVSDEKKRSIYRGQGGSLGIPKPGWMLGPAPPV